MIWVIPTRSGFFFASDQQWFFPGKLLSLADSDRAGSFGEGVPVSDRLRNNPIQINHLDTFQIEGTLLLPAWGAYGPSRALSQGRTLLLPAWGAIEIGRDQFGASVEQVDLCRAAYAEPDDDMFLECNRGVHSERIAGYHEITDVDVAESPS